MFFIQTIKAIREQRKISAMARKKMNDLIDSGERLFDALSKAEDIMGSEELGLTDHNVKINTRGSEAVLNVCYKVDDRLNVYICRRYNPLTQRKLGRQSPYVFSMEFSIDGTFVTYNEELYLKLTNRTVDSLCTKIEEYRRRAEANVADYMAKAFGTTESKVGSAKVSGKRNGKNKSHRFGKNGKTNTKTSADDA